MIHIAEEMKHPERNIPIVMYGFLVSEFQAANLTLVRILTLTIGFWTAFLLMLALMLGMTNIDAVIDSQFPYAELIYQITRSKLVTTALMCWISMILYCQSESQILMTHKLLTGLFIAALIGQWITCGRLAWAFARDVSTFGGFLTCIAILLPAYLVDERFKLLFCIMIPFHLAFYSPCSRMDYLTQPISHTSVNATSSHSALLFSHSASALSTAYCTYSVQQPSIQSSPPPSCT